MAESEPTLDELRKRIDELDAELLAIIASRLETVAAIGNYKAQQKLPPLDTDRWQEVLENRLQQAQELGLAEDFVRSLYELIHAHALQIETGKQAA
jgi:chorismate mutase